MNPTRRLFIASISSVFFPAFTKSDPVTISLGHLSKNIFYLHFNLEKDWITYWKNPGEVGIKPQFEWSHSTNVSSIDFLFPVPKVLKEADISILGYDSNFFIPLEVIPKNPDDPVTLSIDYKIGLCNNVCLPLSGSLSDANNSFHLFDPTFSRDRIFDNIPDKTDISEIIHIKEKPSKTNYRTFEAFINHESTFSHLFISDPEDNSSFISIPKNIEHNKWEFETSKETGPISILAISSQNHAIEGTLFI